MRKSVFIALILAMCISITIIGCAKKTTGLPDIVVAIYKLDDTFISNTPNAIEANAQGKATLTTVDSQNAQPTQNDQVDQFISQGMKAIAINPVDPAAAGAIIDKAKAANIPVVFFYREPLVEDMAKWDKLYYVGSKAQEAGAIQGEILAEYWKATPAADKNGDGKLQYIILKGEPGNQDAEFRTEFSVKAVLDAGIQIELLAEDTAMWDRNRAVEKMDAFYTRFGERIEAVLCNNDDMALGVIDSLRNAGFFTGDKYLPVVGVEATAPALQALSEGALLGTVLNDTEKQGQAIYDVAYALATGADVASAGWPITDGKYIWVPYQKVTRGNYTKFQ
jgi:methyl-galactoside transport system substrate-binding protein